MILITCIIKDDGKYYQQIFLEEALPNKQAERKALKKKIRKELMSVAWYLKRLWNFCMSEDGKKEIKPILTEQYF